jgi:hypothetical protein
MLAVLLVQLRFSANTAAARYGSSRSLCVFGCSQTPRPHLAGAAFFHAFFACFSLYAAELRINPVFWACQSEKI